VQEVGGIVVQKDANRKAAVGVVAALLASLAVMTPAAHAASGAASPGAPTGLTPTPGNTSVALSWTAPGSDGGSAILGYNVYEGTSPGGESATPVNGTVPVSGTSATVTDLTNGTLYYFTVKAVSAVGTSPASNEASATPATSPGAPTGLTPTPGNTSVGLTWTEPRSDGGSAILGYDVYEGTTPGAESARPVNLTLITTTGYTVTGLTTGTVYYFTVKAVNAYGPSAASNEASATPVATAPGPPRDLTATPGNTSVGLTWTVPRSDGGSAILGYNVYEGTTPGGESATPVNGTALVTTTSCVVTDLATGTLYYFTVTAVNAYGSSAASNEASATPAVSPGPPTGLTATPGNASVGLTWTAPGSDGGSAITGYNVYIGTSPGGESATPVNGATLVTTTSYIVTGLRNGTVYYFTVAAVNAVGSSAASDEASATPSTTAPGAPTGLTATPGNGSVALTWTAPRSDGGSAIIGYNVYEGTSPGGESATPANGTVRVMGTSAIVTDLTNGVLYYFTVHAVNSDGSSVASNEASATPDARAGSTTALMLSTTKVTYGHEQVEHLSVVVSPEHTGPAPSGSVTISRFTKTLCTITLASAAGSCTLPSTKLPAGTYSLVATYSGSASFEASASASSTLTVAKAASRTALELSLAKLSYGHEQAEQLSVTVSPQYPGPGPIGSVTIRSSTTRLCVITLSSARGSCTLSSTKLPAGTYSLVATYGGSANFGRSVSARKSLTVSG
jgi:predicted phage tail protein